jgi:hypothetical protein
MTERIEQSMEAELGSREHAIAIYRATISQAAELGAARNDPDVVRRVKRRLAETDLFWLLVYVLGRADLNRDWYFERCREVQAAPNGHLDLWGREHGKSSLITFGLTIQDILNDPEITVGIFSYSRPIAKAFLRQIKTEFENNEMLRSLFPDILWANPQRDSPKFSEDDGIIVRRKGNPKESTVEAWGLVDSSPVSKHFKLMVYDDVVTGESVSTPDMIAKTTTAWERSLALSTEGGAVRYIGTRWHQNDTYRQILGGHLVSENNHELAARRCYAPVARLVFARLAGAGCRVVVRIYSSAILLVGNARNIRRWGCHVRLHRLVSAGLFGSIAVYVRWRASWKAADAMADG